MTLAANHPLGSTGRVLLVDDSLIALEAIGSKLKEHGLDVGVTDSPREALELATEKGRSYDLFILDVMMPEMNGHELTRRLRAHPRSANTPILLLTTLDSTDDRVAGLAAGADDFFTKAVPDAEMLARVRSFISLGKMRAYLLAQHEAMARVIREPEYEPPRARVEILHHEADVAKQLAEALRDTSLGFDCDVVVRPPSRAVSEETDVLVVSYPLALGGEQPLLRRYGFDESAPPIMVVDAFESSVRRVTAFDAGADDYITPQTPPAELAARLASTLRRQRRQQQLRTARDRATLAAVTDPLTGLYNRAYFQEALAVEAKRVDRYGRPMTVALLDLDHFKRVNDTLGHGAGDQALREVAARLRRAVRNTDVLARYGGEEFVVMLPETGVKSALQAAERLRVAVDGLTVTGAQGGSRAITVSIGVACLPTHAATLSELMEHADSALYSAKRAGRNRVCLAAPGTEGAGTSRPEEPAGKDPFAAMERLRQLLAEDGDGPLSSVSTAARMLHDAASPGDPLEALTRQLQESSEEVRREIHGALEALAPLLESRH